MGDDSELQSAMSHQHFGKRVSSGAQVVAFSYLALATRKYTTTTLSYTLSSAQGQPLNQQQQEEEKEAAQHLQ